VSCADSAPDCTPGDTNSDGAVNVLDVVAIVNVILGLTDPVGDCGAISADFDGDGAINVLDIVGIVNVILGSGRADLDVDDNVKLTLIDNSLSIDAKGIGGIELNASGDYSNLNSDYDLYHNGNTIVIIALDGRDITGNVLTFDGTLEIVDVMVANWNAEEVNVSMLESFQLNAAYPNPFNPVTTIGFQVPMTSSVNISVYDVLGRQVATLVDDVKLAGNYTVSWNGESLSSGVYYVRMTSENFSQIQKVMLMK